MLNGRLRSAVIVAGLGLGWTLMAPHAATAQCTYDVYPSSVDDVDDGGDSGSLSVTWTHPPLPFDVDPLCGNQWSGVSNDSWISTSTSDTNNFTLYYTVAANPTAMARTGTITVGGHATFTIDQLAGTPLKPCPPSPGVSRTSLSFTSAGGMQTVDVQEAEHCRYDVSGNPTWIRVRPANVAGDGSVTVTVGRYTGSTVGSGTVTIDSTSIPVRQCPGSPGVSPTSLSFGSGADSKTVRVSGSSGCSHPVSADQAWITVPSSVSGGDSVTVSVTENTSTQSRSGTVTIDATPAQVTQAGVDPPRPNRPPVAVDDTATTQTDTPVTISVLANDTDADHDSLTVAAVVQAPAQGTAVVDTGGQTITYTPPTAWTGVTTFTYRVTDGSRTAVATVTVTVRATNSRPVAVDDTATTQTNTPVAISVLANDTDADNDSLGVAAVVQAPAQGTATIDADKAKITYTPPTDWTGTTTFRYRVSDGNGGTAEATVTVTVNPPNRPPTAHAHFVGSGAVGTIVTLDGTLSRDPDGDHLHYQWTQTGGREVVLLNSTGDYAIAIEAELIFRVPATPGDDNLEFSLVVTDLRGAASEPATVTVTVLGAVLTQHRERLLADLASRGGRTGGLCALWNNLNRTTKEVFLWNTHRLHITGMLPDVTKLYAVYGRGGCGGIEHNRTFMAMTPALRDKLVLIARDQNRTVLPKWRETRDLACTWLAQLFALGTGTIVRPECPHQPFTAQIETFGGDPRGQIQFFGPDYVVVSREYGPGGGFDSCGVDRIGVPRSDVCPAGTTCSGGGPYTGCTSEHSDTIVYDPTGPYTRGPAGDTVTITDALSFEMDQDYGNVHNSAPGCSNMTMAMSTTPLQGAATCG